MKVFITTPDLKYYERKKKLCRYINIYYKIHYVKRILIKCVLPKTKEA